jgi:hypothetical protein
MTKKKPTPGLDFQVWLHNVAEFYDNLGSMLGVRRTGQREAYVYFQEGFVRLVFPALPQAEFMSIPVQGVVHRYDWLTDSTQPIPDKIAPSCFHPSTKEKDVGYKR